MKFLIIFTYKDKRYKHTQEALDNDSAKYYFHGLCYKKGMDNSLVKIESCEKVEEKGFGFPEGFESLFSSFKRKC